jgi:hypothetical protein
MPTVINVTDETISIQARGHWFNWKPGQEKVIRDEKLASFIEIDRRGYGLAVLPDLTTQAEDDGDIEVTEEQMAERKAAREAQKKEACRIALDAYVARLRETIKNAQVSLARDLAHKDYKYDPANDYSDGELQAMRLVAKYDKKGKDAAQERIEEIKKLEKQIAGK